MAKKTVIKSKPKKVIEFGKYGATKEKTVQEVQEIGTFRAENRGVFGILTSITTYLIIFIGLLFASSIEFYQDDPESMQWIDSNGDFKTETYDLTVSYNLHTLLDELNGYSLKQVFEDENLVINGTMEDVDDWTYYGITSRTANNNILTVVNDGLTIGQRNIWQQFNYTLGDVYIRFDLDVDDVWGWAFRQTLWSGTSYYWSGNVDAGNYSISQIVNDVAVNDAYFYIVPRTYNVTTYNLSNVYAINLDGLGINQTKDEMDFWYNEYLKLSQGNMLEDLKTLGAMPLASWTAINEITRSVIDIYEFGMKLVFPITEVIQRLIDVF